MIGPVSVKVSASHPNFPLRAVPVFQGSACSIGVECVPAYFGGVSVTGVSVSVETPDGETSTVAAKRSGCMWVATFGAEAFSVPGSVRNGLTVTAHGIEEDGETPASWTLGKGDIDVISADGVPVPGEVWQNVHLRDSVPSAPVKGDLAKFGSAWKIYTGSAWESFGGGGGGGSVVESPTNPGYAANADTAEVALRAGHADTAGTATSAQEALVAISAHSATNAGSADSAPWSGITGKPSAFAPTSHAASHAANGSDPITPSAIGALPITGGTLVADGGFVALNVGYYETCAGVIRALGNGVIPGKIEVDGDGASIKKGGAEVATEDQLAVVMDLVEVSGGYEVRLGGVAQTFAQVKTLAESRNAVIRHGRGTYRVTYIGASEMMWDCTGTVQNAVQTGTIHMFASGNVVQLVAARELAQQTELSAVSATAAYPMAAVVGGTLKDRTINHATAGGTFTFPARTATNARDFVLVVDALATAPSVTFPSGVTYVSDQAASDVWTAEANKVNAWYFSEVKDGVFMVSHKAMDAVTQ